MQILTNDQFVASKARIGKLGTLVGLGAMVAGFIASLNITPESASTVFLISYGFLIVGILAFNVGRYHSLRWGGRPRPYEILANALKGLDQKYVLMNYIDDIPVGHLLLSPLGIFVLEPRIHDGDIICEGARWKRKRGLTGFIRSFVEGSFGNPTRDALLQVNNVKSFLAQRLDPNIAEMVPVEAVIVFVNPLAHLTVSDPVVPVVQPADLKAQVRSVQGRTKMTQDLYRRLYEALRVNEEVRSRVTSSSARERKKA